MSTIKAELDVFSRHSIDYSFVGPLDVGLLWSLYCLSFPLLVFKGHGGNLQGPMVPCRGCNGNQIFNGTWMDDAIPPGGSHFRKTTNASSPKTTGN
jgi:hypothetical protein